MSAKAVASLSSGLLKRGTRERDAGFVLSSAPAAAQQAAGADHGISVRMRSTGGESWSPGGTAPVSGAGTAATAGRASSGNGGGAAAGESIDGSLEALSRRIGPLVSEYLGSATDPEPAAPEPHHRPRAGRAPVEPEPSRELEASAVPGDPAAEPLAARSGEASFVLPVVERREAILLEMVQAFRNGDRLLGEELFGALTGLAPEEASRLLYHEGGNVLAGCCRALDMDQLHFVSLFVMTRKGTLSRHAVDLRDLGRIIDFFTALSREAGARLLATWRQNAWD